MTIVDGVIKFKCNFNKSIPPPYPQISELIFWRNILFELKLIGVYDNGISYGNISYKLDSGQFIISGSQTGRIKEITSNHFTLVTNYNIQSNTINCIGPMRASSESLTHAAVYESSRETKSVFHIHNYNLWSQFKEKYPTTNKDNEYGTPEIADDISHIIHNNNSSNEKIIIMGGHAEGIIVYADSIDEAGKTVMKTLKPLL